MIRAGLWLISAISLACLTFTSGWAGFLLALLGFTPLVILVILWSARADHPVDPSYVEAQKLSRLDRLDGVDTRKADQ